MTAFQRYCRARLRVARSKSVHRDQCHETDHENDGGRRKREKTTTTARLNQAHHE
jgi:hypothetical protein